VFQTKLRTSRVSPGYRKPALLVSKRFELNEKDAALLLIRIAAGLAFLFHGCGILFGVFGGPGPVQFAAEMHLPAVAGYLVGLAQVAGASAILTGILTRI